MTSTMLDRFVRWNLDFDGDLYGEDERERLRWYEGIAMAATFASIALPWTAAILVIVSGLPVVLPTMVMLVVLLVPILLGFLYVERSRVETIPRRYSRKRILLGIVAGLPWVVYAMAAMHAWKPETNMTEGALGGAVVGGAAGIYLTYRQVLKRRARDAASARDED